MRNNKIPLLCSMLAVGVTVSFAAKAALAEKSGDVVVVVTEMSALERTGMPIPAKNELCVKAYKSLIGQKVETHYDINDKTYMMSATSVFNSKKYLLHPLGLSGKYAFGVYQNPKPETPPVYGVLFNLTLQFTNPVSNIILTLDEETNCLLSNSKAP